MIRILSQNPGEDLRGLLDAALLEAEHAEGDRRERVVAQYPRQAGRLAGPRPRGAQQREQRLRLAVARIERDGRLQMRHSLVDVAEPTLDLRRQAVALGVLRAHLENGLELDLRRAELTVGHERLGQDEASRRVVRITREPIAAERHGVTRPSFAFLSRPIAETIGSTSIDGTRTGRPSVSSMRSCLVVVSSSAMPRRRARRASATIPRETASPWA